MSDFFELPRPREDDEKYMEHYRDAYARVCRQWDAIAYVRNEYLTEELIRASVSRFPKAILLLKPEYWTPGICVTAVMANGFASSDLKDEEKKIILTRAVGKNPTAIGRIDAKDQLPELKSLAIEKMPGCINLCRFQSDAEEEAMQLLAVRNDPRVIYVMSRPKLQTIKAALKTEEDFGLLLSTLQEMGNGIFPVLKPLELGSIIEELGLELRPKAIIPYLKISERRI